MSKHCGLGWLARILLTPMAQGQDMPVLHGTVNLYVGLSEVYRERGDLAAAMQELHRGQALGEQPVAPGSAYRLHLAMACAQESQGDLVGALDLLHEAARLYKRDAVPDVRPAAALTARIWVKQGRLTEARECVQEQGLSAHDDLSYLREFEHITLAQLLIAEYQRAKIASTMHEAMTLLDRLLEAADAGGRMGSVLEIHLLQALGRHAEGDTALALAPLAHALTLAEPEGYVRIFIDKGTTMAQLLTHLLPTLAEQEQVAAYVRQLLASFDTDEQPTANSSTLSPRTSATPPQPPDSQPLIETLTARELDVLELMAAGHSNPQIADELVIAVTTVKTHAKNIYGKLQVANRVQAIARAQELNLL